MAKDWRKSSADAELSRRLDKLEAALRREKHEQELRRLAARIAAGTAAITHLPNGRPVGIRIDGEPAPVHKKLAGKAWVPVAFARRPDELLAMGITGASKALEAASKTDCAKPLKARYIEKRLRELEVFPKAHRGSPRQRLK